VLELDAELVVAEEKDVLGRRELRAPGLVLQGGGGHWIPGLFLPRRLGWRDVRGGAVQG